MPSLYQRSWHEYINIVLVKNSDSNLPLYQEKSVFSPFLIPFPRSVVWCGVVVWWYN